MLHVLHSSDASTYSILSHWKIVSNPTSWEQLIVHFIIPNMMTVLQEFVVNPTNHKLDQFNKFMAWACVISIYYIVAMLEAIFFSKWQ